MLSWPTLMSKSSRSAGCALTNSSYPISAPVSPIISAQREKTERMPSPQRSFAGLSSNLCDRGEAISKPGKTLGDRGFASTYGLPDLETLELRMVDVERLVLAGILVGGTKCLRLGPRFESTLVLPDRMRRIEREVVVLGSLQQVKFDEARHLVQLRVAAEPHLLERLF